MSIKFKTFLVFFSLSICCLQAQIEIVKKGKPISKIIVDQSDSVDYRAAILLQDFVNRISGANLQIEDANIKPVKNDIVIKSTSSSSSNIKEDGFHISTQNGILEIIGGEGKGSIYGVVTLLEDYLGVKYYVENAPIFALQQDIILPQTINQLENPSFRYRQTQSYSLQDSIFKIWHRLEEPDEVFASNLWVHTFNNLLPASKYGKDHPEYYAFINGERRPGTAAQWCLSNPDVLEIVALEVDSIFKANPDKNIISISQNDSQNYCQCDTCQAIYDREGTSSGAIIYFLNKLAQRFPDREFSTLAYLYSVAPPKLIKPLPNVNIMLCDIDCHREVPLTDNKSGKNFVKDMEGWSAISDNIYVWDYGINFDNYIAPFPNFHILQPNMKLFKENNATMHFSQIGGDRGTDFAELRTYLVAKLLWNVDVDVNKETKSFLSGYYGSEAAPYIYDYLKLREGALLGSNVSLWIYDTPITHKNGMLNKALLKKYNELFDKAEQVTSNDSLFLARIKTARLPIQYSELEIARTEPVTNPDLLRQQLHKFRDTAASLGINNLNEKNNKITSYCDLYEQRNLPKAKQSLARNAKVTYVNTPSAPYDQIGDVALTDGLYGGSSYNESWVGWISSDADFIIDLGQIEEIKTVEVDCLHHLGAWVLLPKSITCETSVDNVNFTPLGHFDIPEDREMEIKYVNIPIQAKQPTKARYIKVKIESLGLCPNWHYGVGFPAWFFIDEVSVY